MPELLTPGVYIQEVAFGPSPIEGVATSTAGFVGEAERGPVNGVPLLVTSFTDFQRQFGGFVTGKSLAYAVRGFFDNGGKRAFIARVATTQGPGAATRAQGQLNDGYDVALLAPVSISSAQPFTLRVASVVGLKSGDRISIIDRSGALSALTPTGSPATVGRINATAGTVTLTPSLPPAQLPGPLPAVTTGSVDLSVETNGVYVNVAKVKGTTLTLSTDVAVPPVATFDVTFATVAKPQEVIDAIQAAAAGKVVASLDPATHFLVLTSTTAGPTAALTVVGGSALGPLGLAKGSFPGTQNPAIVLTPAVNAVRYAGTTSAARITITARDVGAFGKDLRVRLTPIYRATATITAAAATGATTIAVSTTAPFAVNDTVELENASSGREVLGVTIVDGATSSITLPSGGTASSYVPGDKVRSTGWRLEVFFRGALVETIDGIGSNNDAANGLVTRVGAESQWVQVDPSGLGIGIGGATDKPSLYPLFVAGAPAALTGATDGDPVDDTDVIGSDVPPRSGLKALEALSDVEIIAAPGFTDIAVVTELIGQAERRQDRFAVFEGSLATAGVNGEVTDVLTERGNYNSQYAAMYYPWVTVLDPLTNTTIPVPPSGHVIGAYANTDDLRGVFKAPANVVLQGITGFTRDVPDGEQDLLNPNDVNVLRNFTGLGKVIWGARTIAADGLWKYVPVRRLFIFLEQSIIKGTRYAVFEPNDIGLWKRLHDSVTNFLTTQWRAGALFGKTPQEAFFVKVDETTTTQDDRDNGRVNILVGIAPVKPAEFIVFQIGQAPSSVIIAES